MGGGEWGGGGGGRTNLSCQLKFRLFVSCQFNKFSAICQLIDC